MSKAVTFHDEAPDPSRYRSAIARAKQQGRDRPTTMEGTPRFDSMPTSSEIGPPPGVVPKEKLSERTATGLAAMQEATRAEAEKRAIEQERTQAQDKPDEPQVELSDDEKLRQKVESRLDPIDIGHYLLSGEVNQVIPIIPDKLVVRFRSVTALEEVFVDADLASIKDQMTGRQFIRKTNEWALATHIHTLNGTQWPTIFDGDGTINKKSMDIRLQNVRKLSSPIFQMLTQQLQWFLDRVSKALTMEALGNG